MTNYLEKLQSNLAKKSPLYIKVKVVPKSSKNEIVEMMEDGTYKIRVAALPIGGKANAELLKFLKKSLKASEVVIVSGQKDRTKLIRIQNPDLT